MQITDSQGVICTVLKIKHIHPNCDYGVKKEVTGGLMWRSGHDGNIVFVTVSYPNHELSGKWLLFWKGFEPDGKLTHVHLRHISKNLKMTVICDAD